jgi:hypothetical protein
MAELKGEIDGLRQAEELGRGQEDTLFKWREATEALAQSNHRLRAQGMLDEAAALEREIRLMEQGIEEDSLRIKRRTDALRLRLWREGEES